MQPSPRAVEPLPPVPNVGDAAQGEPRSLSAGPGVEAPRALSRPEDVSTCNGREGAKRGVRTLEAVLPSGASGTPGERS